MMSVMKHFVLLLSVLSVFSPCVEAGVVNQMIQRRAAFLALNLVDIRCPSKMNQVLKENNKVWGTVNRLQDFDAVMKGRRLLHSDVPEDEAQRLLEQMVDTFTKFGELPEEEPDTLAGYFRRALLAGHKFTLKEWRVSARKDAVYMTDQICGGAPDDKGPGAIFPLHLDIVVQPVQPPTPAPFQELKADDPPRPRAMTATPAPALSPHTRVDADPERVFAERTVEPALPEGAPEVEPVILEDSGPNAVIVMGLLLMIGVGMGVGITLFLVKGNGSSDSGSDKETKNLKAKLKKLRDVVDS